MDIILVYVYRKMETFVEENTVSHFWRKIDQSEFFSGCHRVGTSEYYKFIRYSWYYDIPNIIQVPNHMSTIS